MRVIYFERMAESEIHIHAGSYVKGVYIPDESVVLYKEGHGTFGGYTYSFIDSEKVLDEMRPLLGE